MPTNVTEGPDCRFSVAKDPRGIFGEVFEMKWYVDYLRNRKTQLQEYQAGMERHSGRVGWRNPPEPFRDTTGACRAELDRRVAELSAIISAFEMTDAPVGRHTANDRNTRAPTDCA